MKTKNYFNTTGQNADYVSKRKSKNITQEDIVYDIFKSNTKLTASQVLDMYPKNIPITSIRRAMSNLQYDNKIIKTTDTKLGIYGAPEHYYRLHTLNTKQTSLWS
jgi:CDP-diacylglycerol pyrophosphatase